MSCQYAICWQANTDRSVHNTATSYQSSTLIVVPNPAALAQVDMQTAEFVKCSRCENTTLTAGLNTREPRDKTAENLGVSATCCQHHVPVWVLLPGLRRERENEIMRETHAEEVRERERDRERERVAQFSPQTPCGPAVLPLNSPLLWFWLVAACRYVLAVRMLFFFFLFFFKDRCSSLVDFCCSSAGLLETSQIRSCQKSDRQRKILLVRVRLHTDLVPGWHLMVKYSCSGLLMLI